MFGDDKDELKEEVEALLNTYTLEEILEHNDMDIADALVYLYNEGYIVFPEARPI